MERGNKDKPLWSKHTRGTITITAPRRMRLKHKQRFRATPEELGRSIAKFTLLEGDVNLKKYPQLGDEKTPAPPEEYTIKHKGGGWYNVLSPTGEVMNEDKLKSEQAEALCKKLSEKSDE